MSSDAHPPATTTTGHSWLPSPPRGTLSLFFFLTFYFAFFVCISFPHLCSPMSSFFLQSSAKLPSADPAALPPESWSALPFVPRSGLGGSPAAPGPGLWAVGKIVVFNQQAPVGNKGGVGGLPEFLAKCPHLPASALCRPRRVDSTSGSFHACHQAPSGLARGQSSPLLTQGQKSNNAQGQAGPLGAVGAEV